MCITSWADEESGIYLCYPNSEPSLPQPIPDTSYPKSINVYFNGNIVTGSLSLCSGRWITLHAEGGFDSDYGTPTNPNSCDFAHGNVGCHPNETCASVWSNNDTDFQWTIGNVAA